MEQVINSQDFLNQIRRDPELFLKKNRWKEYTIKGTISNYQPEADFLTLGNKRNKMTVLFPIASIGYEYSKDDLPAGSVVIVKGKLNFIQWFDNQCLNPTLIRSEILEIE